MLDLLVDLDQLDLEMKPKNKENRHIFIAKLWISGNCSSQVVIPKVLAEKFHMTEPCHVKFELCKDGILLSKIV